MRRTLCLLLAATAPCGCASLSGPPTTEAVVDHQKVELIDRWARRSGVTVIWLNKPLRYVPIAPAAAPGKNG